MSSGEFDMDFGVKVKPEMMEKAGGILYPHMTDDGDDLCEIANNIHIAKDGEVEMDTVEEKCIEDVALEKMMRKLAECFTAGTVKCTHYSDQTDTTDHWKYIFDGKGGMKVLVGKEKITYE